MSKGHRNKAKQLWRSGLWEGAESQVNGGCFRPSQPDRVARTGIDVQGFRDHHIQLSFWGKSPSIR